MSSSVDGFSHHREVRPGCLVVSCGSVSVWQLFAECADPSSCSVILAYEVVFLVMIITSMAPLFSYKTK